MPTYEYLCKCGHSWEEFQRISDKPVEKCPKCEQADARRQIGATHFVLSGSGWAADGYGPKG